MNRREIEAPKDLYNVNPMQWEQAIGLAQDFCSAVASKGGCQEDAAGAYGLQDCRLADGDWDKAAQLIALTMCSPAHQRPC